MLNLPAPQPPPLWKQQQTAKGGSVWLSNGQNAKNALPGSARRLCDARATHRRVGCVDWVGRYGKWDQFPQDQEGDTDSQAPKNNSLSSTSHT